MMLMIEIHTVLLVGLVGAVVLGVLVFLLLIGRR